MRVEVQGRIYNSIEEMCEREDEILRRAHEGNLPDAEHERLNVEWQALSRARLEAQEETADRRAAIRSAYARGGGHVEAGTAFHDERSAADPGAHSEVRDGALRTIDRYRSSEQLTSEAADRLDGVVKRDRSGLDARYLAAVGDPNYNSAFGKLLADPVMGYARFTTEEVAAVQRVNAVEAERAALNVGTGAQGQFAIPFTLDPTVIMSSSGALNPVRQVARVIQITTDQWKGVSSDGVTAAYAAEATEASDNAPTLSQPVADTAKGQAFHPLLHRDRNGLDLAPAGDGAAALRRPRCGRCDSVPHGLGHERPEGAAYGIEHEPAGAD